MSVCLGHEDSPKNSSSSKDAQLRSLKIPETISLRDVLQALPEAIYLTDPNGLITFYNEAAASLWGVNPPLGQSEFCGSWKLYWPDGTPLPHHECPMALTLKERRPIRGMEAVAERPDGSRIRFLACPSPLFDAQGNLSGAVNMLIDLSDQIRTHEVALIHDAIVESSDDAIIAKNLDGRITNWNQGAYRLFGYTSDEAIGQSIEMLIPQDRKDEEPGILSRIRSGERIEHYETIRRRKNGSLVEISLSVSPVRNREGRIIGAAKIARDITDRRQAEAQKNLMIREMDHRIKNLFTLANCIVRLSSRSVKTSAELASVVSTRLSALAQAHALTVPDGFTYKQATTLHALIRIILSPYSSLDGSGRSSISIIGPDLSIADGAVTSFALMVHEFATNAAKYGALSSTEGRVEITCVKSAKTFELTWDERNGPRIPHEPENSGFGTTLAKSTIYGQLRGTLEWDWNPEGLTIFLKIPISEL